MSAKSEKPSGGGWILSFGKDPEGTPLFGLLLGPVGSRKVQLSARTCTVFTKRADAEAYLNAGPPGLRARMSVVPASVMRTGGAA